MTITRPHLFQLDGLPEYYVAKYGAVGDGETDDSSAINDAIDAAFAAGGGDVVLDAAQYARGSGIMLKEGVHIRGQGIGATELVLTGSPDALLDSEQGSLGDAILLTSQASISDDTLALASTTGLAAGDYLLLKDDLEYSAQSTPYRAGEIVRIESVDSATQVTLYSPVGGSMDSANNYAYVTANTAQVKKVNYVQGFSVQGMTITGLLDDIVILIRFGYAR